MLQLRQADRRSGTHRPRRVVHGPQKVLKPCNIQVKRDLESLGRAEGPGYCSDISHSNLNKRMGAGLQVAPAACLLLSKPGQLVLSMP